MDVTLTVADVARRIGVTPKTVRYYETIGLVPPAARGPNGYRQYQPEDLHRLRFIQRAKALGLTLAEVHELLAVAHDGQCTLTKAELRQILERKITSCSEHIETLVAFRAMLEAVARTLSATPDVEAEACCPSCAAFAPSCTCVPTPPEPGLDFAVRGKV